MTRKKMNVPHLLRLAVLRLEDYTPDQIFRMLCDGNATIDLDKLIAARHDAVLHNNQREMEEAHAAKYPPEELATIRKAVGPKSDETEPGREPWEYEENHSETTAYYRQQMRRVFPDDDFEEQLEAEIED